MLARCIITVAGVVEYEGGMPLSGGELGEERSKGNAAVLALA